MKVCAEFGLLLLISLSQAAYAQAPALAPELKVGDTWEYRSIDGYGKTEIFSNTVTSVSPEGHAIEWESKIDGKKVQRTYTKDWNPVKRDEGLVYTPYYPYLKFPLSVGKTWSEESSLDRAGDNTRWTYSTQGKVVSFGKVKVAAGEFDAYEVTTNATYNAQRPSGRWGGRRTETWWYAPAVKSIVKSEFADSQIGNTQNRNTSELQSLKLN